MWIKNFQDERRLNIKFCVWFFTWAMEMIKMLRETYGSECMSKSMIHRWHSTFSKNLNEAPQCEKKGGWPQKSIKKTNINTARAVIDDDRHLPTKSLQVLLHIPWMIIYCILAEKLEMECVASTFVLHTQIHIESASKFLGFIAEDSAKLNACPHIVRLVLE